MIAIIDYGVGNLFSLTCSLNKIGAECVVTSDTETIKTAEKLILPGVGAFGDAAAKLKAAGLDGLIKTLAKEGKPLLGICLGMQLLFDKSYEFGEHEGLGLIKGEIKPLDGVAKGLKIPHMGWNSLKFTNTTDLFKNINDGDYVYFVHSFYADCGAESKIAVTDYGGEVTAAVQSGNIYGVQFHPEKSGSVGLRILSAFCGAGVEK